MKQRKITTYARKAYIFSSGKIPNENSSVAFKIFKL